MNLTLLYLFPAFVTHAKLKTDPWSLNQNMHHTQAHTPM